MVQNLSIRPPFESRPNDSVFLVVYSRCQMPRGNARQQYGLLEALAVDRVVMIMRCKEAAQREAAVGISAGPFQGTEMCRGRTRCILDDRQLAVALQTARHGRIADVFGVGMERARHHARRNSDRMHEQRVHDEATLNRPNQLAWMPAEGNVPDVHYQGAKMVGHMTRGKV